MGNAKICERFDDKLEEREKEKKTKGLECCSTCFNLGRLERETRELLKV